MSILRKPYGGVYENMDFEKIYGPKSYQEYPKHIATGPYGQFEVAHSKEQEDAIIARLNLNDELPPEPTVVHDPEKEILISRARELDVPINTKWSKQKIRQTIEIAEPEFDALPPEAAQNNASSDEREKLYEEAKSLGINKPSMHLWGAPRLKAAIEEHKAKGGN